MTEHDMEKWQAYHATLLELEGDPPLRVDLRHPDERALEARLRALGLQPPVAILTAENPFGANAEDAPTDTQEAQRAARNDQRHAQLLAELRAAGLPYTRVDGMAPDGEYRERCVAVPQGREAARTLARRLGQLAFYWFEDGQLWLEPGLADHAPERLPTT